MKHMKFAFIAVALIAILSAFTTKGTQSLTFKKYGLIERKVIEINNEEKLVNIVKEIQVTTDFGCDELIDTKCTFETETLPTEGFEETDGLPYFLVTVVDPVTNVNVTNIVVGQFIDLD